MDKDSRSIIQNPDTILNLLSRGGDSFWVLKKRSDGYKMIPGILYISHDSKLIFSVNLKSRELALSLQNSALTFLVHKIDCSLEFQTTCLHSFQDPTGFHIELAIPIAISRLQRRQSYRVPVHTEGVFIPVKSTSADLKSYPCLLVDLSLHGCLIVTVEKLNLGEKGHMSFILPSNQQTCSIDSTVQRERDLKELAKSLYNYQYGIKFNYLEAAIEKQLAAYLNQLQIQLRQSKPA